MSSVREPLIVLGGAALVFLGIGYLSHQVESGLIELRRVPEGPLPAPGPAPLHPFTPSRLSEPFIVSPGGRYAVALKVSFPLSLAVGSSDILSEARTLGFTDPEVRKDKPGGLPIAIADYYIVGAYGGQTPRTFAKSNAHGQVTLVDVWRLV